MKTSDIRKGDIITYRKSKVNYVNKPFKYEIWFDENFQHKEFGSDMDIMKIERYVKFLCFYRLKTIYERKGSNND